MNSLLFRCPKTGRGVEVGINIDYRSLRLVQPVTVRLVCPLCQTPHEWKLSDGLIEDLPDTQPSELTAWSACRDSRTPENT